jgi:sortase (surface protein transpeptidase)
LPARVQVPGVRVDAETVPVGVRADRSLILPAADQVGWWIGGAQPGDHRGTVVLAGHVDDKDGSPGALYNLSTLRPGDPVEVKTIAGRVDYRVVALRSYPRQQLPSGLFDRTGPHRLVLITCGGKYVQGDGYAQNVVAYAEPLHTS